MQALKVFYMIASLSQIPDYINKPTIESNNMTNSNAKVFVTTYALYNEGLQFKNDKTGFWIDTANVCIDSLIENFKQQGDHDPELMYTDFEGFPESLYSECGIDFDIVNQYDILGDEEKMIVEYLVDHIGYSIEQALEKHEDVNVYEGSMVDYAYDLVQDCYNLPDIAQRYFDYEAFARDLELEGDIAEYEGVVLTNLLNL